MRVGEIARVRSAGFMAGYRRLVMGGSEDSTCARSVRWSLAQVRSGLRRKSCEGAESGVEDSRVSPSW